MDLPVCTEFSSAARATSVILGPIAMRQNHLRDASCTSLASLHSQIMRLRPSEGQPGRSQSVVLHWMIFSTPQADWTMASTVLPSSMPLMISSAHLVSSSVGSPVWTKVGRFRSSFVSPDSSRRLTSPLSASADSSWYSVRFTNGTSRLCEVGQRSSYFLPVKMSSATMCALACPCFPVFEVDTSMHLHGWPLIIRCEPFLISPACWG
mmetsp:Transcript_76249/g.172383  ORF Transcript_76249/g.172383 Transcript_76249/m.172383 type:complete len:208 (-) Transcript_76249:122-745(-)